MGHLLYWIPQLRPQSQGADSQVDPLLPGSPKTSCHPAVLDHCAPFPTQIHPWCPVFGGATQVAVPLLQEGSWLSVLGT